MVKVFYPSGLAAKKGIIISVFLNGAMAAMSNQQKSRLESGCDYTAPPPGENRPEAFSVSLNYSLNLLRLL